eukprot:176876-Pyramimonas_sp.AAC.1
MHFLRCRLRLPRERATTTAALARCCPICRDSRVTSSNRLGLPVPVFAPTLPLRDSATTRGRGEYLAASAVLPVTFDCYFLILMLVLRLFRWPMALFTSFP